MLPGSGVHQRYRDIEEVGLALVLGADNVEPETYNPLTSNVLGRVAFAADNLLDHPSAWQPLETDEELLGGTAPTGIGRFTAFALAKINALSANDARGSHRVEGIIIAPGQVGFAGGQRLGNSLLAVSGLWEVHDHLAGRIYAGELSRELGMHPEARTEDMLAAEIEPVLDTIKSLHEGTEAADLSRSAVAELVSKVDDLWPLRDVA